MLLVYHIFNFMQAFKSYVFHFTAPGRGVHFPVTPLRLLLSAGFRQDQHRDHNQAKSQEIRERVLHL